MTDIPVKPGVLIRPLMPEEPIPYDLLLLADPSMEQIDAYLPASEVYVALLQEAVIGALVLYPATGDTLEIKTIAVDERMQGKGIGSLLIREAIAVALKKHYSVISVATANSSIAPLYLYQKHGFDITAIRYHFFTEHYPEPIYENGIRARHLIILSRPTTVPS